MAAWAEPPIDAITGIPGASDLHDSCLTGRSQETL
jgi:hypothetical protein